MKKIILSLILCWSVGAMAQSNNQFTRVENKTFDAPEGTTLRVNSSFGNLTFTRSATAKVEVKVTAIANVSNKALADKILAAISVSMKQNGQDIQLVTKIGNMPDKKGESSFEINYDISLPVYVNLDIDHEFGNITLEEVTGDMDIDLGYGAMYAKKLHGKQIELNISFSKATIESLTSADVELSYGSLDVEKSTGLLNLHAEFSGTKIAAAESVEVSSSYDEVSFDVVRKLSYNASFSTLTADLIETECHGKTSYGSVVINKLGAQFETFNMAVSFGGIKVRNSNGIQFQQIDVTTEMGGFSYPDRFRIQQKEVNITDATYRGGNAQGSARLLKANVKQGSFEIQ